MGTIARHAGAPFADGETVDAGTAQVPDGLELDVATMFAALNGSLTNANIAAGANIQGSKFAPQTGTDAEASSGMVVAGQVEPLSVEQAQIADGAIGLDQLAANAATQAAANTSLDLPNEIDTAAWTEIHSASVATGASPNSVVVFFTSACYRKHLPTNQAWSGVKRFLWRLLRNGTAILTAPQSLSYYWVNYAQSANAANRPSVFLLSFAHVDQSPAPETFVTYSVEVQDQDASETQNWFFEDFQMLMFNARR